MSTRDLDARLELRDPQTGDGSVFPYRIINTGTVRLICGGSYVLERDAGGEWEVMNPGMAFTAIGFVIEAGHERQLWAHLPAGVPSGDYRIRTSVSCVPPPPSPRSVEISAPFHLR